MLFMDKQLTERTKFRLQGSIYLREAKRKPGHVSHNWIEIIERNVEISKS